MHVFRDKTSLTDYLNTLQKSKIKIGFVPTMGALHEGHLSLINRSKKENDITICSIFVNPTQFNNPNDLKNYPIQHKDDIKLLEDVDCDIVFIPKNKDEIYINETPFAVELSGLDKQLEGKFRPGHFDGVMRVVKLLFEIINPTNAYFGLKDYQQYLIISKMVNQLQIPVNIIGCEIKRNQYGLALSSRNQLLNKQQLEEAKVLYETLQFLRETITKNNFEEILKDAKSKIEAYSRLDYLSVNDSETLEEVNSSNFDTFQSKIIFVASFFGDVRLIDNLQF